MRDLIVVADKIIEIIQNKCTFDKDEVDRIVTKIEDVKSSYLYSAPELYYLRWNSLADILCDNFNPDNSEWETELAAIFKN